MEKKQYRYIDIVAMREELLKRARYTNKEEAYWLCYYLGFIVNSCTRTYVYKGTSLLTERDGKWPPLVAVVRSIKDGYEVEYMDGF